MMTAEPTHLFERHVKAMILPSMPALQVQADTPGRELSRAEIVVDQRCPCRYCKTKTIPRPGRAGPPTTCSVCGRPSH